MKLSLRIFFGAALALFAASAARAQLSPTGISASPGSALPGDSVTFTITVSNAGAQFNGTADFSLVLTNLLTGATVTLSQAGVSPTGGFIPAAVPVILMATFTSDVEVRLSLATSVSAD